MKREARVKSITVQEECSRKCESCEKYYDCTLPLKETFQQKGILRMIQENLKGIKHKVIVLGGKGGVGKSLVTSLLAASYRRMGHQVGVLDADITGPSIPKMFFANGTRLEFSPVAMLPAKTRSGIAIMSINLLLENEDQAVVWRGPLISNVIRQFWSDVVWGDLDYLLVDLPPGTSDASLTVLQSLPLSEPGNAPSLR